MITWSFILNGQSHIIELYNSKLSGKKKLLVDRNEIVKSKSSSLFQYGFRLSHHYFKIIQHSGEIFDLLIDNVSFDNMMNDERAGRLQKPPKKKEYSSSSYKHEDLDKEYARYHLQQIKNNSTNKHVNDFYQNGNYKKEQKYYDYNIGNEFDFSGGKSNKYPSNYQSGNSSSNKVSDFNNVQRSNKQSEQTFQHNKSILNNIGDVFGDNKGNEINLERNMNILENIDMEQILGGNNNNSNNKGNDMFAFEMNNQGQQQSFQNNNNNNQNNFYQQPRQGNVDGFMGFNNMTPNNNNIGNNGFMQEQQHQQQPMQFNNNNNYNQFTFDNQQNQMQFNNNNNNNTNYPQLDNQQPSNYTLNTNNQNYIQQNQTQPQPQTMLNTNQFISQPLPERNQTNTNNNNNIQAFDPSPSYFQTINQPQLSTPSLMNDPTMVDPSSFNNPSQFTNNNQQQQIPNNNIFTVNIESQSKTPIIPQHQHQQEPPQNELKTKLMSTGLVNIDNLFGDSSQPNTNLNYNFNNFDK